MLDNRLNSINLLEQDDMINGLLGDKAVILYDKKIMVCLKMLESLGYKNLQTFAELALDSKKVKEILAIMNNYENGNVVHSVVAQPIEQLRKQ